jgi:hypothetical protein
MVIKLVAVFVAYVCLIQLVEAAAPVEEKAIQVFISPECKNMFYGPDFVDVDANGRVIKTEKKPKPDYVPWDSARAKPRSYKDPRTTIIFYVESDGRHLAAIGPDGTLLWIRNPFKDRHGCPYRTPRPVITLMEATDSAQHTSAIEYWHGDKNHHFIFIQFDSSQFGVIDQVTGDFYPEGQN